MHTDAKTTHAAAAPAAGHGDARDETELQIPGALYRHRRILVVAFHLVLVASSYALAFMLRFDRMIPAAYAATYWSTLGPLLVFRLSAFAFFRLFSGWWRYVGMRDLHALLKAVALSSVLFVTSLVFTGHAYDYPRSVLVIDAILTLVLIGGVRFALRAVRESRRPAAAAPRLRRVLIIGAGDAGELLLREMHNNPRLGYVPVGFVDDDPRKTGFHIHGVPVRGTSARLAEVLAAHPADELIIAIPSASRDQIQAIVNRCLALKLPFKILPAIAALTGRVHLSQVRPVRVEDLLGRDPVDLDATLIRRDVGGKRVVITGAGGSIGSELARQIAAFDPATIALVERGENALFLIEQELRRKHPTLDVRPVICDIRDTHDLARVFREVHPDLVYHAAAFKHVPMMEAHLAHAVHNNVFGTRNVAGLAAEHGAKFVLISTDKAVSPSNIMGATKRLAEKLVLSLNAGGEHHFVAVRFGNVLGSNGSVVPLFTEQIADGGPVTVTHPEATRYFMTIPEAVQLVLQASVLEEARDKIVMLEMGAPVRIVDLARNLIRLSGLEPDVDIPIVFTGLRPGEKLHEQLTSDTEETIPTRYEKIRIVRTDAPASLDAGLQQLWDAVIARDERIILRRLQELVPEFAPQAALIAGLRDRLGAGEARPATRNVG
ncbi:MAG TPA: nucleoside-diphosphate sugar epimerase/dehydratase [Gemmatimonadaceae bacterium]|nr:nucleoside-diphosphate sugar epimerase/dehydratase [Gemmatimonadaceae bacterium]